MTIRFATQQQGGILRGGLLLSSFEFLQALSVGPMWCLSCLIELRIPAESGGSHAEWNSDTSDAYKWCNALTLTQ